MTSRTAPSKHGEADSIGHAIAASRAGFARIWFGDPRLAAQSLRAPRVLELVSAAWPLHEAVA